MSSTSQHGYQSIESQLHVRRAQFMQALRALDQGTANEVAAYASPNDHPMRDTIRKRAKELCRLGLIEVVGYRPCSITNRTVMLYAPIKSRPRYRITLEITGDSICA